MSERQDALTAQGFEHVEPTPADVAHYYDKAVKAALYIVEDLARKALVAHPELNEFVMAMGIWGFSEGDDDGVWQEVSEPLMDFIGQWDEYLKLTGTPMRFTATGLVVREW